MANVNKKRPTGKSNKTETSMSATAILGAAAGKKGLENVVNDVYGLIKKSLKHKVSRWRASGKIDQLYRKWRNIRYVKTIWQVERAVDLAKFYCPSKVEVDGQRKQIDDIDDLPDHRNIVIRGTVGQGKSIFFRYLTARELAKGDAIPLFVELRRIGIDRRLSDHLLEELESLGIKIDSEILNFLCDQGKVILFLDAFDEIDEQQRTDLVEEIEHFCKRYDRLRIFVSSRPNSGIESSAFFRVCDLSPLADDEYQNVIWRMSHKPSIAQEIISGVARTGIAGLLTTPLMVALLLVRYRIDGSIPENTIAFYDDLFYLLLRRHDKSKAGYVRPRKSKLGDHTLKQLFDAICYLSRKEAPSRIKLQELHRFAEKASSILDVQCDVVKVVEDVIEITCLILEEGGECRFVHKSVQEFHAASFVAEQRDEAARRFYQAMNKRWKRWEAELAFLFKLDKFRFQKWFLIPDLEDSLGIVTKKWSKSGRPTIAGAVFLLCKSFLDFRITIDLSTATLSEISYREPITTWSLEHFTCFTWFPYWRESLDCAAIIEAVNAGKLRAKESYTDAYWEIEMEFLLKTPPFGRQVTKVVRRIYENLAAHLEEAKQSLERIQNSESAFDF